MSVVNRTYVLKFENNYLDKLWDLFGSSNGSIIVKSDDNKLNGHYSLCLLRVERQRNTSAGSNRVPLSEKGSKKAAWRRSRACGGGGCCVEYTQKLLRPPLQKYTSGSRAPVWVSCFSPTQRVFLSFIFVFSKIWIFFHCPRSLDREKRKSQRDVQALLGRTRRTAAG